MDVESSIETIAVALAARDGRGGGRATAMIGAGFSLNAQPRVESRRRFPLWRDIVRPLIDELLPPCAHCPPMGLCPEPRPAHCQLGERRRALFEDASGASGMMSLGDKFEAQKGSARLRAALETAVPDADYAPGLAHQLLVRLPWADIFTTNWDSLLERAVDTYDRSYDSVVTVEQIASTCAPRIVKLHGCARSGSRLIFTEEDFRTYPKTYAPFVSLVQQSLMENVTVLFGFSGADPNFRAWHGWVRDHLGRNIQPIYLVSLRPTDPIDVNLMAGRLINQIDLSQKREWQNLSSNEMIEKFLSDIHNRLHSLRVNLEWPTTRRNPSEEDPSSRPAKNHLDWRRRLDAYPRWLVAPARNRSALLLALDEALSLTFDTAIERGVLGKLNERADAKVSRRPPNLLTEREKTALIVAESLRIGLARPGGELSGKLKNILLEALVGLLTIDATGGRSFNSLQDLLTHFLGDIGSPDDEAARAKHIIKASKNAFSGGRPRAHNGVLDLLPLFEIVEREARLDDDAATAQLLRDVLWMVGGEGPGRELAVRGALAFALTHLQIQVIDELLSLWPDQPHDAASNLRRSATLREIGWIKESFEEISGTVARLRSLGSARRRGVAEASKEAWAFYLYADLLEANKDVLGSVVTPHQRYLSLDDVIVELHERLDELETNRCDPRREIDRLFRDLDTAAIQTRLGGTAAPPSFKPPLQHIIADPASTFVILSEAVGVAANHSHGTSRLALIAARLLAPTHRQLAIGLLLRAGTPEDLRFTRPSSSSEGECRDRDIVRLTDEAGWRIADVVFDRDTYRKDFTELAKVLDRLVALSPVRQQDLVDPPYLDRKVRLLQHLVAGLIAREEGTADRDLVEEGFLLACRVARSPIIAATRAGWANQSEMFDVVLRVFPCDRIDFALESLLSFPIPAGAEESLAAAWPDPFRLLVEAWYEDDPNQGSSLQSELRDLGKQLLASAKPTIQGLPEVRSAFAEKRRTLRLLEVGSSSELHLMVRRRISFLDEILSQTPP
ncbi:SIR2 family NAD-dependent protein deacylase [Bradyrhizobium sp. YCK136]|uniref:SIR2 family NAD-dependent protein deacylase n=1 Tax=Bradyrhizobium sp. YCK136 TaxID=3351346 RepID=UPI0037C6841C